MSSKDETETETENDKTLMSSNEDNGNDNENEDEETMSQNKESKIIKDLNDLSDEIIEKSRSFEEQTKSLKKTKRSRKV